MLSPELKSKIDAVWEAFYTGGISNPLETIEQITYLLFLRRLDDEQIAREGAARWGGGVIENPIFDAGSSRFRWSAFRDLAPAAQYELFARDVFPWMRALGGGSYAANMENARFTIPMPALLSRVIDLIDGLEIEAQRLVLSGHDYADTKGDIYEYLLDKLKSAGRNGQFRTPRHIIEMMVALMAPKPGERVCDPACGTAGFLVYSALFERKTWGNAIWKSGESAHFWNNEAFTGFDFDQTMLRIASMNMMLHGVDNPRIRYRDSLSQGASGDAELYDVILANPPFAGSLDESAVASDLKREVKTKKTELLFLALFLRLLKPGGRAAVIVPDGVLFGSSSAHKTLRQTLVEKHRLQGVISMPSGVFKPYAGVSTAILLFSKTGAGGTGDVWFFDMKADGFSLDDKRQAVRENDIPKILEAWTQGAGLTPSSNHSGPESPTRLEEGVSPALQGGQGLEEGVSPALQGSQGLEEGVSLALQGNQGLEEGVSPASPPSNPRTSQSFFVPKSEIAANGYDLSLNRYKEVELETQAHRAPTELLADLRALDAQIQTALSELEELLV